jgi:hypothetical protein
MSHARPVLPSKAPGVSSRRDSQSEVETSNKRKRTSTTKELPDLPLGGPFVIYVSVFLICAKHLLTAKLAISQVHL